MVLLDSLDGLCGMKAPDFNLLGVDDKYHKLSDYTESKLLVIIFMCNHCPYVLGVIDKLNNLSDKFREKNVQFIGINSNDASSYPADSFENMQKFPINFPYLYDEKQAVAKEYQAVCTPDIFVFDSERKLAYHGRIDNNWKDQSKVTQNNLEDAIKDLLSEKKIPSDQQFSSMGCSIKWK